MKSGELELWGCIEDPDGTVRSARAIRICPLGQWFRVHSEGGQGVAALFFGLMNQTPTK